MKRILALAATCAAALIAQTSATQWVYGYSGGNLVYSCSATSVVASGARVQIVASVSAATNANPVVLTSTAHNFASGSRPTITLNGATGNNWKAINGTFAATVIDANTFSIPVDSTAFGALAGTVTYTTTAPRLNQSEWEVILYAYDGSNNLVGQTYLNGVSGRTQKCSDATNTSKSAQ